MFEPTSTQIEAAIKAACFHSTAQSRKDMRNALIASQEAVGEKRAPVQGLTGGIPWSLHLEAYAVYSKKWAPQPAMIDLEGRGCRGGFSTGELDEFIPDWRERISERTAMQAEIAAMKAEVELLKGRLTSIGDLAHDTSTGPAVQDTYWEIRSMAYADV